MAKRLSSVDFNNLPAINFKLNPLASAPASPGAGTSYFDTVSGKPLFHNGTAFLDMSARANHTGTQLAATISDFNTAVRTNRLDQMAVPTNALSFNNQNINGVNAISATTVFGYTFTATDTATSTLGAGDANQFVIDTNGNVTTESDITQTGAANFTFGTGTISASNNRIQNLAAPVSANDAARLVDIQSAAAGIDSKQSVRLVSTTQITVDSGGLPVIDGVQVADGDRILLVGQTSHITNGVYIAHNPSWTRAQDANESYEITPGAFWFVEEGTTYGATQWRCSNTGTITLGTTNIDIVQFGASAMYTASNGVQLTGSNFTAVGDATKGITTSTSGIGISLEPSTPGLYFASGNLSALVDGNSSMLVSSSGIGVKLLSSGPLQHQPAGLTINTDVRYGTSVTASKLSVQHNTNGGTYNSTTGIAIKLPANSGLVADSTGLYLDSSKAVRKYTSNIGDGSTTSINVNHALGSADYTVSLRDLTTNKFIDADVEYIDTNNVKINFDIAPATNNIKVVVHA